MICNSGDPMSLRHPVTRMRYTIFVIWLIHICDTKNSYVWHDSLVCRAYEWVMSHIWIFRVTNMNESYHKYTWVMSHVWKRCVTQTDELLHTCEHTFVHVDMYRCDTQAHTRTHTQVYINICIWVCVYVCIRMYICIQVSMYMYKCICTYIYISTRVRIHTGDLQCVNVYV